MQRLGLTHVQPSSLMYLSIDSNPYCNSLSCETTSTHHKQLPIFGAQEPSKPSQHNLQLTVKLDAQSRIVVPQRRGNNIPVTHWCAMPSLLYHKILSSQQWQSNTRTTCFLRASDSPKFGAVNRSMRPRLRIFAHPIGVRFPVTKQVTTLSIA